MDDRDHQLGELMAQILAALNAGQPTEVDRLLDAAGDDRNVLLDMVELALSFRGPPDPNATAIAATAALPAFQPRAWPELLIAARHAQGLKRGVLVEALAERLHISSARGRERLRERYHEVETGQINPHDVSEALLGALGGLLGGFRSTLDSARLIPTFSLQTEVKFMRDGVALDGPEDTMVLMKSMMLPPDEPTDEERAVDTLFGL